jgi:hypothetical protein
MSNFEERLLSALKEEITTGTEPVVVTPMRRPRRRLVGLTAAVAGVAAAATLVVTVTGVFSSPAYAVTQGPDGAVGVRIDEFRDPGGLAAELADAGVKAVVDYLPYGQTCQPSRGQRGDVGGQFSTSIGQDGDGISFRIEKGQVPAGQTLVLAVTLDKSGADAPPFSTSLQVVKGAVADCEPTALPAPPAGGDQKDDGPSLHTEEG